MPVGATIYIYGAASQRGQGTPLVGNVVGRITHIADGAGTEDRLYGPLGEIVQETRAIPIQGGQVPTYVTQFTYDTWNRIKQMIYPDNPNGELVQYFYDYGGLVRRVHGNDDQLETDYAAEIDYDRFGQRVLMSYGNSAVNTYAYQTDNRRLHEVTATLSPGGYMFHDFVFSYDNVGNVTQLQNNAQFPGSFTGGNLGNDIGGPWTKAFNYDDLYRLTASTGTHSVAPTQTYTYSFSQAYDSIHNITHKSQIAMQGTAVNPQTTYDYAYTYPAPGSAHPHGPTAIGEFNITNDADGNQTNTLDSGTNDQSEYLYDEENRLSCANKGPQTPSPSCSSQGNTSFIYDHDGVRKVKTQSSPTIYPNQYYTDFGGGSGNQFKHVFVGSERILTKKARIAPDRQHWYYHPDHLGSTSMVTNENDQLVDAVHYFPFGEVWLEERPASLPQDYFFTAKELDSETGFYDFGARYLDPRFSKWMTADPGLGDYLSNKGAGSSHAPLNISLYSYGWHNPATVRDPDGACVNDNQCNGYWGVPTLPARTILAPFHQYQDPEGVQDLLNFHGGTYRADPQVWEMDQQIDVGTQMQTSIRNNGRMRPFYDQARAAPGTAVNFVMDKIGMNEDAFEAIKTKAWPFGRVSGIATGTITARGDGTYTVSGTLQIKDDKYSYRADSNAKWFHQRWEHNLGIWILGQNRNGPDRGDMTLNNGPSQEQLGWDKRIQGKLWPWQGVPWSHEANGEVDVTYPRPYHFYAWGSEARPANAK